MKRKIKQFLCLISIICGTIILLGCSSKESIQKAPLNNNDIYFLPDDILHKQDIKLDIASDLGYNFLGLVGDDIVFVRDGENDDSNNVRPAYLQTVNIKTGEETFNLQFDLGLGYVDRMGTLLHSNNTVIATGYEQGTRVVDTNFPWGFLWIDFLNNTIKQEYVNTDFLVADITEDETGTVYQLQRERGNYAMGESVKYPLQKNWRIITQNEFEQETFFDSATTQYQNYIATAIAVYKDEIYVLMYDVIQESVQKTKSNPYLLILDKNTKDILQFFPLMKPYEKQETNDYAYRFSNVLTVGEKFMAVGWGTSVDTLTASTPFSIQRDTNGRLVGVEELPYIDSSEKIDWFSSHVIEEELILGRYIFLQQRRGDMYGLETRIDRENPLFELQSSTVEGLNQAPNIQILDNETGDIVTLRIPDFPQDIEDYPYYIYASLKGDIVIIPGVLQQRRLWAWDGYKNDVWYYIPAEELLPHIEAAQKSTAEKTN